MSAFGRSDGDGKGGFGRSSGFGGASSGGFGERVGAFGIAPQSGGFGGVSDNSSSNFGSAGARSATNCRNCGEDGHYARACPKGGGGQGGMTCFNCNKSGHRRNDCPEEPRVRTLKCYNCGTEGHSSRNCTEPKKEGARGYNSSSNQNRSGFGSSNGTGFGSAQAESGGGFGSANSQRFGGSKGGFGNSEDTNAEKGFGNADSFGEYKGGFGGGAEKGSGNDRKCYNCNGQGHMSRECPEPSKKATGFGGGRPQGGFSDSKRSCYNCGQDDHMSRDCPEPRKERPPNDNKCRNCNEEGHIARDCTRPRKCRRCNEEGHEARECPQQDSQNEGLEKPMAMTYVPTVSTVEQLMLKHSIDQGSLFDKFFEVHVQVSLGEKEFQDDRAPPIESFEASGLASTLVSNLKDLGYQRPTPIQKHAIPIISAEYDVMACAQTGSGKTAAYFLPILSKLITNDNMDPAVDQKAQPRALVVIPTRELAIQVFNEGRKFARGTMAEINILYGGTSVKHQVSEVAKGCSILIATPGRLAHFIDDEHIDLKQVCYLVLDEADRMLDMGFGPKIEELVANPDMKPKTERQTLLFSATFNQDVQELAKGFLKEQFAFLTVGKIGAANTCISQKFMPVSFSQKSEKLCELLKIDLDTFEPMDKEIYNKKTLVFVQSKRTADTVAALLSEAQIMATSIHGDRKQQQREEAIGDFESGRYPVLVATAVAARGLDIRGVDHVINFDLPESIDEYVNRIGRTGRIGHSGRATSFYDSDKDELLVAPLINILTEAQQEIPDFLFADSGMGSAFGAENGSSAFGAFAAQNGPTATSAFGAASSAFTEKAEEENW